MNGFSLKQLPSRINPLLKEDNDGLALANHLITSIVGFPKPFKHSVARAFVNFSQVALNLGILALKYAMAAKIAEIQKYIA